MDQTLNPATPTSFEIELEIFGALTATDPNTNGVHKPEVQSCYYDKFSLKTRNIRQTLLDYANLLRFNVPHIKYSQVEKNELQYIWTFTILLKHNEIIFCFVPIILCLRQNPTKDQPTRVLTSALRFSLSPVHIKLTELLLPTATKANQRMMLASYLKISEESTQFTLYFTEHC